MERECNKCIHHTSGTCSSWDCKMQTVEDVKKEAVKEYVEAVVAELENASYRTESTFDEDGYCNDDSEEVVTLDRAIEIVRGKE